MSQRLANKIALITGAGTGIGAATARGFAEEGALVVLCGRRREPLEGVADEIGKGGGRAQVEPLDESDGEAVNELVRRLVAQHGRHAKVVNDDGLMVPGTVGGLPHRV